MEENNNQQDMEPNASNNEPRGKFLQRAASGIKSGVTNAIKKLWEFSPLKVKIAVVVIIIIVIVILALLALGMISGNTSTITESVSSYVSNMENIDESLKTYFNDKKSLLKFNLTDINKMYESFLTEGNNSARTQNAMQTEIGSNVVEEEKKDERIVDIEDKLPIYEHILLTEKYNFNKVKWNKYTHANPEGSPAIDEDFIEDKQLGIKYPKDASNTNVDTFVSLLSPYLQTWYIPLAMFAGNLTNGVESEANNNPDFAYNIIKEAYSNIVVDWREMQQCQLTTKYETYTRVEKSDSVTIMLNNGVEDITQRRYDSGNIISTKYINTATDTGLANGSRDPSKETAVSKLVTVTPTYFISLAETFDIRIINEFDYVPYSDSDVDNKTAADSEVEEETVIEKPRENINDKTLDEKIAEYIRDNPGKTGRVTLSRRTHYEYEDAKEHVVTRTWQDKAIQKENKTEKYTINDIILYNQSDDRKVKVEPDDICGEDCAEIAEANREIRETGTTSNANYAVSEGGNILELEDFTDMCNTESGRYYRDLQNNEGINRIDLIDSNPDIFNRYIGSEANYLPYVGYSRSKLTFAYWNLKNMWQKIYSEKNMLPWVYGKTVGFEYNTYGSSGMCGNVDLTNVPPDGFAWPVEIEDRWNANKVSSSYGMRDGILHAGIDIYCTTGGRVYDKIGEMDAGPYIVAAHDGVVLKTYDRIKVNGYRYWSNTHPGEYGNYVDITTGGDNPFTTKYLHLSEIYVREGDRVTRGQRIGRMGMTGNSTGVHLHLYVWNLPNVPQYWSTDAKDPLDYYIMEPTYVYTRKCKKWL